MRVRKVGRGWEQLTETFAGYARAGGDLRPAWQRIADDLHARMRRLFNGEAGWSSLSPGYLAWKSAAAPGAPAGVLSDDLVTSLTSADHRWSVHDLRRDSAALGTAAPHAHLLHGGATRSGRGGRQPARPIEPVDDTTEGRWLGIVADHIAGDERRIGL